MASFQKEREKQNSSTEALSSVIEPLEVCSSSYKSEEEALSDCSNCSETTTLSTNSFTGSMFSSTQSTGFIQRALIELELADDYDEDGSLRNSMINNYLLIEVLKGDVAAVEALLDQGADPNNTYDINGHNAFHLACIGGKVEIVRLLLERGARIDQPRNGGSTTPLLVATRSGHIDVVKLLLEKGANVNYRCSRNYTAVDYAFRKKHLHIVDLLRAEIKARENTVKLGAHEAIRLYRDAEKELAEATEDLQQTIGKVENAESLARKTKLRASADHNALVEAERSLRKAKECVMIADKVKLEAELQVMRAVEASQKAMSRINGKEDQIVLEQANVEAQSASKIAMEAIDSLQKANARVAELIQERDECISKAEMSHRLAKDAKEEKIKAERELEQARQRMTAAERNHKMTQNGVLAAKAQVKSLRSPVPRRKAKDVPIC